MHKTLKQSLIGVAIVGLVGIGCYLLFLSRFIGDLDKQMTVGQAHMESLTYQDFQIWIERTEML